MDDLKIVIADWTQDRERLSAIRRAVFIKEQNVPEELEWDEDDARSTHFLAYIDDPVVGTRDIACARLTPDGKLGRMAVLQPYRNSGIGYRLLQHIIDYARDRSYPSLYMHAQTSAMGFYEKAGFTARGEVFQEAGIPHCEMVLKPGV